MYLYNSLVATWILKLCVPNLSPKIGHQPCGFLNNSVLCYTSCSYNCWTPIWWLRAIYTPQGYHGCGVRHGAAAAHLRGQTHGPPALPRQASAVWISTYIEADPCVSLQFVLHADSALLHGGHPVRQWGERTGLARRWRQTEQLRGAGAAVQDKRSGPDGESAAWQPQWQKQGNLYRHRWALDMGEC